MMEYLQLIDLRNDAVADALLCDEAGDPDASEEMWSVVASFQDDIEAHVNYQRQYDSLAFYLSTLR